MRTALALAAVAALLAAAPAGAQQKIGYLDSDAVLEQMPEYRTAQQELDRLAGQWQAEVDALAREGDEMEAEFAAREILYTDDERRRQLDALAERRQAHDALRRRYFGPEGELFRQQQALLRPVQERLLAAVDAVATEGEYDYVFDRSGDFVFLYTRPRHDLTELVLEELGVGVGVAGPTGD